MPARVTVHDPGVRVPLALGTAWLLVVTLAACGGSEGAPAAAAPTQAPAAAPTPVSAAPTPPPATPTGSAPSPAPAPAPAPTPTPTASSARCTDAAALAQAIAEINRVRAAGATCGSTAYGPAGPVTAHPRITQAALGHSTDMAQRQFFSHTGSDGSSIGTRLTAAGYPWSRAAENIAAGYPTVGAVVQGWVQSPGHCVNLMNPALTDAGLACVAGPAGSAYSNYWTLAMGRPR